MVQQTRILVVEDEPALLEMLCYNLEAAGYGVDAVTDGQEALYRIEEAAPDLVLLDWMLPSLSGLEICRHIRRKSVTSDLPVIMLTARGEEYDKIRGLDAGADDYIPKPFSPKELNARIRALLRRSRPSLGAEKLTAGSVTMNLVTHTVSRNGRDIHLGPTEFRLLRHFLENPRRVFTRDQLLDAVWGRDVYVEQRTVDVHIRRLRKALNGEGEKDVIRTVRSTGYALEVEED